MTPPSAFDQFLRDLDSEVAHRRAESWKRKKKKKGKGKEMPLDIKHTK